MTTMSPEIREIRRLRDSVGLAARAFNHDGHILRTPRGDRGVGHDLVTARAEWAAESAIEPTAWIDGGFCDQILPEAGPHEARRRRAAGLGRAHKAFHHTEDHDEARWGTKAHLLDLVAAGDDGGWEGLHSGDIEWSRRAPRTPAEILARVGVLK